MKKRKQMKARQTPARTQTRDKAPQKSAYTSPYGRLTMDALVNQLARTGTADNLRSYNGYRAERITQNWTMLDALYRSDWIARRVIDTIPEDMLKNGYNLTCQVEPDQQKELEAEERRIHLWEKLAEGLKLGRLYGGAAGIIVIKGHEDMLDQPLDMRTVMPGAFRGLIIADRWNGIYPSIDIVDDLDDPDFGLPDYYTVALADTELDQGIRIHHSRVVRFTGRYLPYNERINEEMWGMSEIEHIFDELDKRNSTSANIAQLIFSAHLRIFKMGDLGEALAIGDPQSQADLYNTARAQNELMNSMSLMMMDRDDDFQTCDYSFSGLSEIYEQFMMDIAGAAEIPATKLFGRSPQGMNATGESDLRNYYDVVKQAQETYLRPVFDKLLPILCLSTWGAVPDDLGFDFAPIRDTSDEERANMIQQTASAINSVYQSGIISQRIAMKELRMAGEPLGMWTNITDEDIENADPSLDGGEGEDDMGGGDPMAAMMAGMGGGGGEAPAEAQEAPQQPAAPQG